MKVLTEPVTASELAIGSWYRVTKANGFTFVGQFVAPYAANIGFRVAHPHGDREYLVPVMTASRCTFVEVEAP